MRIAIFVGKQEKILNYTYLNNSHARVDKGK